MWFSSVRHLYRSGQRPVSVRSASGSTSAQIGALVDPTWTNQGPTRDPRGIRPGTNQGSSRDPTWTNQGPTRDPRGIRPGPTRDPRGILEGSNLDQPGIRPGIRPGPTRDPARDPARTNQKSAGCVRIRQDPIAGPY